jgi:hypothetical protein
MKRSAVCAGRFYCSPNTKLSEGLSPNVVRVTVRRSSSRAGRLQAVSGAGGEFESQSMKAACWFLRLK